MKVIDQFYDVKTGEHGRREIEVPGVITEAEGIERDKIAAVVARRNARMAEIRDLQMERSLLGEIPDPALVAEYAKLKAQK